MRRATSRDRLEKVRVRTPHASSSIGCPLLARARVSRGRPRGVPGVRGRGGGRQRDAYEATAVRKLCSSPFSTHQETTKRTYERNDVYAEEDKEHTRSSVALRQRLTSLTAYVPFQPRTEHRQVSSPDNMCSSPVSGLDARHSTTRLEPIPQDCASRPCSDRLS